MLRVNHRSSDHLLWETFSLEDLVNLSEEDILLLAELDADPVEDLPLDSEKTEEERQLEQRLLAHLVAQLS